MNDHPRAMFLALVAIAVGCLMASIAGVDQLVIFCGLVWVATARYIVKGYTAYQLGRVADRQWQAHNPKSAKPARAVRGDELRVVRGSDGGGRRLMV